MGQLPVSHRQFQQLTSYFDGEADGGLCSTQGAFLVQQGIIRNDGAALGSERAPRGGSNMFKREVSLKPAMVGS